MRSASVRTRLLLVALLPLAAVLALLLALLFYWGGAWYDRLLVAKINSDLAVAHQYFNRVTDRVGDDLAGLAASEALAAAIRGGDPRRVDELLERRRRELHLDFLRLRRPDAATPWPVLRRAAQGKAATEIDVYPADQLEALDPALARQARLELVPTANAAPDTRTAETRGLVIHNATPVAGNPGRPQVLEGGVLLNQNLGFVDTINELVYPEGSLPPGSHGTATLFLGDVRIATNVRLFGSQRALGTRVSQAVRDQVLGAGRSWRDRAFVVSDWYISAYEPIRDSFGQRVGMLYVGYLETPFRDARLAVIAVVVLLFAAASGAGIFLSFRVARGIFRPLQRMNATMSAVEAGDASARSGAGLVRDEIGLLAGHLDELLDRVQDQNLELKRWGEELDAKVAERTAELERANQQLREAQRQLALSDKLAAIGEITAGVAHEINNPVAVIQGNLDLLRELLGPAAAPVAQEIRLIDRQVERINAIVARLLQFARPDEFAGYLESVAADELIDDCLVLVRHLLQRGGIELAHRRGATRAVRANRNELQQVLINLMVNAIHAMPGGGRLTLATRDTEDPPGIAIDVADTGVGIAPENLERVFDAFFTTRREGGTGLGLSISYTIVARYGGKITVASREGEGSTFTVLLPAGV